MTSAELSHPLVASFNRILRWVFERLELEGALASMGLIC